MPSIARSRSLAYHRQHGRCFYCYAPMWSANPSEFAKQYGIIIQQALRLRCTVGRLRARQEDGAFTGQHRRGLLSLQPDTASAERAPARDRYRSAMRFRMLKRKWQGP